MRPGFSPISVAATVLLHAAIVVAIATHLSGNKTKRAEPAVISVQLLASPEPPLPQAPPSIIRPAPTPPTPAPAAPAPPPAKKAPAPKPSARPRTQVRPHATPPAAEAKAPDKPITRKPAAPDTAQPSPPTAASAPSTASAPPAPSVASVPAAPTAPPAAPPSPARTAVSDASYAATNRKPPYPALSRRYEEQGTVVLRVLVKPDGTAGAVELKASSGYPLLDESARTTVQTWRFNPATMDGKPIAEWYQVSIPFKLQD